MDRFYNWFTNKLETLCFWIIIYERLKHLSPQKGERRVFVIPGEKLTAKEARERTIRGIQHAMMRDKLFKSADKNICN